MSVKILEQISYVTYTIHTIIACSFKWYTVFVCIKHQYLVSAGAAVSTKSNRMFCYVSMSNELVCRSQSLRMMAKYCFQCWPSVGVSKNYQLRWLRSRDRGHLCTGRQVYACNQNACSKPVIKGMYSIVSLVN